MTADDALMQHQLRPDIDAILAAIQSHSVTVTGGATAAKQDALLAMLTPKTCVVAPVSFTSAISAADYQIVAAVPGKRIKVYAYGLYCTGVGFTASWRSATTTLYAVPTPLITGAVPASVNPPAFIVATNAGEALQIRAAGVIAAVSGWCAYWADDAT